MKPKDRRRHIIMKYPVIRGNNICDGREHSIIPSALREFTYGGRRFLIMDYYDESFGAESTTILLDDNGTYYKVPLEDYSNLYSIFASFRVRDVGLDELDGITYIDTKKPVKDVFSLAQVIEEAQKKPEKKPGNKPLTSSDSPSTRMAIIVYVDTNGNFYITVAAAHQLFDISLSEIDQTPSYRLTIEQLEYIRRTFHIKWEFIIRNRNNSNNPNGPIGPNNPETRSPFRILVDGLSSLAARNGRDKYSFLSMFVPIRYVSLYCDDSVVHGGVFNLNHLNAGLIIYRYRPEKETYERTNDGGSEPYSYLRELLRAKEGWDEQDKLPLGREHYQYREEQLRRIETEHSIEIDAIPDLAAGNALYRFVGQWEQLFNIESVTPLETDGDLRRTLSSCLLGYIDSRCSGTYIDREFYDERHSDSINIKEYRREAEQRKQTRL